MSANPAIPQAAICERSEWRGEDVEPAELAERLVLMNREHARHAHGHAATRTLNLLVAPGDDVTADALTARLAGLHARHPARTIIVREHAPARLDATLAIDCGIGSPGVGPTGFCHDGAELLADAERLRHADSLVRPLRVSGLPTLLWLPGAQASPAERPLAALADAIVLDSGATHDVAAGLARAAELGASRVRDLAWLRLARWRQRIAERFEAPAERALLERVERVELRCAAREEAPALLLAGWIVARAGWTLVRLEHDDGGWRGSGCRADGGEVALALLPPSSALPGIEALTLRVGDGRQPIELLEPVAEPGAGRAFGAALRDYDEPAPGYALALSALLEGLGAR
ncbi:MAG TPA: glucose-6-phosphate dehydrogenase assembly protein OpcA [Conexibacter sp.]|nr:glucose-6-phosphate dehydrogenase assembly protein OpcA [Conexibacter sp.]